MALTLASSPFTHNQKSTQNMMQWVMIACLPGIAAQIYFFGYGNLIQACLAIITALICEAIVLTLRRREIVRVLADYSAFLTGLLLGISLPPLLPWWMVILGSAFSIIIAKQLYGGLGQNLFNPAMIGYVVLLISFPIPMTSWLLPQSLLPHPLGIEQTLGIIFQGQHWPEIPTLDGITQATPLDSLKTGLYLGYQIPEIVKQPMVMVSGQGWQWVNIAFLVGGILLLLRRVIQWYIPLSFLLTLSLCYMVSGYFAPDTILSPWLGLLSGATMLGAFFIATDPVTAATTPKGRLIFGGLIGFLVWLIRTYGGYPDGLAFAVLLANLTVPLIDNYTQPRVYGQG